VEWDRPAARRTHRHDRRLAGLQEALSLCAEVQAANRGKWSRPATRHCAGCPRSRIRIGIPGRHAMTDSSGPSREEMETAGTRRFQRFPSRKVYGFQIRVKTERHRARCSARVVESALPPAGGPHARPPRGGKRRHGGEIWTSARLVPRCRQPIGDFAVEALNELSVVSLDHSCDVRGVLYIIGGVLHGHPPAPMAPAHQESIRPRRLAQRAR